MHIQGNTAHHSPWSLIALRVVSVINCCECRFVHHPSFWGSTTDHNIRLKWTWCLATLGHDHACISYCWRLLWDQQYFPTAQWHTPNRMLSCDSRDAVLSMRYDWGHLLQVDISCLCVWLVENSLKNSTPLNASAWSCLYRKANPTISNKLSPSYPK